MKYIISALFIYLIFGLIVFIFQRKILFNTSGRPNKPEKYELHNVKEIKITTPDRVSLLAWYSKPQLKKPTLIYFHGNSYDIGERSYRIKKYIDHGWGELLLAWERL